MWVALLVLLVPVFCREAIPSIVVTPYQSARYGTTAIVIQCTVSSSSVATSVGWGKVSIIDSTTEDIDASNSNEKYHIIDSMINPHLTINNIVFSDETIYVCFATNVAGTGQSNYGILNVTSEIPSIIATPLEQFPVVGSTKIVIECNISSSPTAISVGWQRTSLDGSSTRAIVVALSNGKYHVDNSLVYPHLTINDILLADDAYYVCFATNVAGKGISNSARVNVIDTPLTVHAPVSEYSISVGTTVTMQCSVTSGIATSIKWLKNNEIIVITEHPRLNGGNSDHPSLIISSVEEDDLGYYICQATNGILTVYSDDIFLVPKDIKAPLSIKVNTTQYSPTLWTSVTLNCEINTGKAVSVRWSKNDDVIVTADNPRFSGGHPTFPSLKISQVEQNDIGYYICQASDGVNTVNTDTIALSPKGIAPIVDVAQKVSPPIIGQEFIISCTIDSTGSNLQKVQWIFKDLGGRTTDPIIISTTQPFKYIGSSVNNPSLTINDFQSSDVGSYMCRAINDWGSSVSSTTTVYSSGTTIQASLNVAGNLIGEINDKSSCWRDACYRLVKEHLNWEEAKRMCVKHYGETHHLVTISSQEEQDHIEDLLSNTSYDNTIRVWIGLEKDTSNSSILYWVDGSHYLYSNWEETEPNNDHETCGDIFMGPEKFGYWNDEFCDERHFYICEGPSSGNLAVKAPVLNYTPTLLDSVTLQCSITHGLVTEITWFKNNKVLLIANDSGLSGGNERVPSLTIISVTKTDMGYYICQASNVNATVSTFIIVLSPKVPPSLAVNVPYNKYSPQVSTDITLECLITSGAPTSVKWHVNNIPIRLEDNLKYSGGNKNTPSLTIMAVEQTDLGYYICLASNEVVTVNSDIIALLPVGTKPVVRLSQTSYIQLVGLNITLTCEVQSQRSPMQEVQWIFVNNEGATIDPIIVIRSHQLKYQGSTSSDPSLTIINTMPSDVGTYKCRARNLIGTTVSDTISLMIQEVPIVHIVKSSYFVNRGEDKTLKCTVSSDDALQQVFWTKDISGDITVLKIGSRYHGSSVINPSLTISNVVNADEGLYTCFASNIIGIGNSQSTILNVTGNANITITALTSEGDVVKGRSVTVICKAHVMYPEGTVFATWKLNNSVINPTNSSKWIPENIPSNPINSERLQFRLTIINLHTSDSGKLTCAVSDGFVNSEKTINLNVIGKPVVSISPRTSTVKFGDSITITCTVVKSYFVLTSILWYKNGDLFTGIKGEVITRRDNTRSTLVISGIHENVQYECSGINNYGEGDRFISHLSVIKPGVEYKYCPVNVDKFGSVWVYTVENTLVINPCPGSRPGTVSRLCNSNGEWEEPNYSTCISDGLLNLNIESDFLKNGVEVKDVNRVLSDLNRITTPETRSDLTSGELDISSKILDNIASYAKERKESLSIDQLEIFVSSCDNLLVEKNIPSWEQLKQLNFTGVTAIAKAVTVYTKAYTNVNDSVFQRTVQKYQLVVQVGKVLHEDITFPKKTEVLPDWITESANQVTLSKDNFEGQQPVGYSTTYYRNISNLFHEYHLSEGSVIATNGSYDINSVVIDFSIEPTPTSLQRPLIIKFEHVQVNYSNPVCAFWDFDALNTPNGAWSFVGSKLVTTSERITVCQYDHTTNFALLMSPGRAPSSHSLVLSKISAVGCGISIVFLVVTVMIHGMLWRQLTCDMRGRKIKRDKAILLVNFCVALTLSYILFLSGVTQTGNKKVCTAMAVLLHYIFLVDFAFMFAEGIEIAISVLFVFATSSRTKWLIPTCWVSPAVIVGISMGATKLDGYGNSQYCWLSVESNLIWAFVGPALTVILVNLIILILVLRTMFATHAMMDKTTKQRAKAGIRSLCVILPLFGVTWVLGVLSVNEETVVFQYLFAVFNSLQGFFIFLFHTVFNQQIREGIQTMRVKRADKSSIYSKQSSQKTTRESFATSTNDSQRESSDSTSILKAKTLNDSLVTSFENGRNTNQNSLKGDKGIVPENDSKTTTDVHGPVKADNGKQTSVQNKSKSDEHNKKSQQSNDSKDVALRRSHTVASGSQNQNGQKSHKKDKRRSQYNSRPENISVYYFDNPVMSNEQTRRTAVENPSSTFGNERQRKPDEYQDQRGNKIRWSADC